MAASISSAELRELFPNLIKQHSQVEMSKILSALEASDMDEDAAAVLLSKQNKPSLSASLEAKFVDATPVALPPASKKSNSPVAFKELNDNVKKKRQKNSVDAFSEVKIPLAKGWTELFTVGARKPYYFNEEQDVVTWTRPDEGGPPPAQTAKVVRKEGARRRKPGPPPVEIKPKKPRKKGLPRWRTMHGRVPGGVSFSPPTDPTAENALIVDDEAILFASEPRLTEIYDGMDSSEKMQFRLTSFSFYTEKEKALCPLDFGLIEKDVPVFACGVLKPIYDDDADPEGWPICTAIGPIVSWHTEGFDGGGRAVVGCASPYAEYKLLGEPAEVYAPFFKQVTEKAALTKGVIEFLSENPEAEYERLLAHLLMVPPPTKDSSQFCEDDVLRHLKFLLDQVWDYDQYKADSDAALCDAPAVEFLLKLEGSGVSRARAARRSKSSSSTAKGSDFQKRHGGVQATVTPLVENVFSDYFKKELAKNETKRSKVDPTWTNFLKVFDGEVVFCNGTVDGVKGKSYGVLSVVEASPQAKLYVCVEEGNLRDSEATLADSYKADCMPGCPSKSLKTMTLGGFEKLSGSAAKKARESIRFVATDFSLDKTAREEGWLPADEDHHDMDDDAPIDKPAPTAPAGKKKKELPSRSYFNDNLDTILTANGSGDLGTFHSASHDDADVTATTDTKRYLSKITLVKDDISQEVCLGDCVLVSSSINDEVGVLDDDDAWVLQINHMYVTNNNKYRINGLRLIHGRATVLGRVASTFELFAVDQIASASATSSILCVLKGVVRISKLSDWAMQGNVSADELETGRLNLYKEGLRDEGVTAFVWKLQYDVEYARFSYPKDVSPDCKELPKVSACVLGVAKRDSKKITDAEFDSELRSCVQQAKDRVGVRFVSNTELYVNGVRFSPGDGMLVDFKAVDLSKEEDLEFSLPKSVMEHLKSMKNDTERFPEAWRKKEKIRAKGSHDDTQPFRVLRLEKIDADRQVCTVRKFYRPENTRLKESKGFLYSEHEVFYSEEVLKKFDPISVLSKCVVAQILPSAIDDDMMADEEDDEVDLTQEDVIKGFQATTEERFFFRKKYTSSKEIVDLSEDVSFNVSAAEVLKNAPIVKKPRPLRLLDIFAGCGGLSTGLQQAEVCESKWAIEFEPPAAMAFAENHPDTNTLCEDCNMILRRAMDGETTTSKGQPIPQRGEVEALAGGPPCQGFSGMNRFNHRQYSRFKNSLVATYLSYCDFYRPKLFLLENVKNFSIYHEGIVVQMCMRALVEMGYQATFGCVQAGSYGVPQSRRRLIIMASRPGQNLPYYPEPEYTFTSRATQINVKVNGYTVCGVRRRQGPAPFRRMTVRDAIGDLPVVPLGESREHIPLVAPATTDFQKRMRDGNNDMISNHMVKKMSPLVQLRFERVPVYAGADWRDLPNEIVEYTNGKTNLPTKTVLLEYPTGNPNEVSHETRTQRSWDGGVGHSNQDNTIIPWCLPHTGNRHNNWAGLYGRLDYNGHFGTTVTNPEPMGKQGVVVHPEQHRVVSVRECARSQGFPDAYKFVGHIIDRHRQIGNAVPPPLARAVGQEWFKVVKED